MSIDTSTLTPAQETLFLTLAGRALDSRLERPFLGDPLADEIFGRTGYDLATFPTLTTDRYDLRTKVFGIAVRAKRLDEVVRKFVGQHPDAVVLDLGAGLDTRFFRIDPAPTVEWYDVDFPEVIALREQLVPARPNAHPVAADLTTPGWLDAVPTDRPAVIVHDGLLPFLAQDEFVALLRRLTAYLSGGEQTFNGYTTLDVRTLKRYRDYRMIGRAVRNPGFNDPHAPEGWAPGLRLAEEIFLARAPEATELSSSRVTKLMVDLVARSTYLSRLGGTVLRYTF